MLRKVHYTSVIISQFSEGNSAIIADVSVIGVIIAYEGVVPESAIAFTIVITPFKVVIITTTSVACICFHDDYSARRFVFLQVGVFSTLTV
jgi:hypothetical protein